MAAPVAFSQSRNFALPIERAPPSSSVGLVAFMHWLKHTSKDSKACRKRMVKIKKADEEMKRETDPARKAKAMQKLCKLTTAGLKPAVARSILIHATCLHTYPYITRIPRGAKVTDSMISYAMFLNKKKKENKSGWKPVG